MTISFPFFEQLKRFISFDDGDVKNLRSLAPVLADIGPSLTDAFYEALGSEPTTAAIIDGRVEGLKQTHRRWLEELAAGEYGENYFMSRVRIGQVHVMHELDPSWVEAVMSIIRTRTLRALADRIADPTELADTMSSFIKICDLDILVINLAYAEERLERLSSFTGMKRTLIENIIRTPPATQPAGETC